MHSEHSTELRGAKRTPIRRPAQIKANECTLMYAMTTDISASGLGIVVPSSLSSDEEYEFVFEIPLENQKKQIQFLGVVAYCNLVEGKYRAGIRISEIHPASLQAFNKLFQ